MVPCLAVTREWQASDYHRLSAPQVAWGRRVLARLDLAGHERVVDAGCGTGRLAAELLDRLPAGQLLCLDRSHNMIVEAARFLQPLTHARGCRLFLVEADLRHVPLDRWADVVFSTATFHWVPDHPRLFAEIFRSLDRGGRLLAQCGGAGNLDRVHGWAARVCEQPEFAPFFTDWTNPWVFATPDETSRHLGRAGFVDVDTSLEAAPTPFDTRSDFEGFLRTVVLRPFIGRLTTDELARNFVTAVADEAWAEGQGFWLDYWRLNLSARRPPG